MSKINQNLQIDVCIMDLLWHDELPDIEAFCADTLSRCAAELPHPKAGEVSIALMNDAKIQALNAQYRHKNTATNVLSFPDNGPAPILGDIAIARETVLREAEAAGKPLRDHLAHMLIHGYLHLQGYDHETDTEANLMEGLEIKALALFNIDNPYKINEPRN